ncbi:MAG TPA: LemA family protein [Actinomycetota bacterium]
MIVLWIVLGIIVLIGIGVVVSYNRFVNQRTLVQSSWANIDTELKRRYDLIPNLVETVKGYAAHEREVFEDVARTRSAAQQATGSPAQQAAAEGPFVAALGRLFAVAENYPELKANQNFLALQSELSNTEDRIQAARRFYNSNVQDYNRRIQQFPSSLIASFGHFTPAEFFEIPEAERAQVASAPRVDFSMAAPPAAPPPAATPPASPPATPSAPPAVSEPPEAGPPPAAPEPGTGGGSA